MAAAAYAGDGPRIQFETNYCDFGKVTGVDSMSGVFKFKNTGTAELRLGPVTPSCDCTEAKAVPDIAAPGQAGEIRYTIKLDHATSAQRIIRVHSNDPENSDVPLTVRLDYTPLYKLSAAVLWLTMPAGTNEVKTAFTITRTDGAALDISRVTASHDWVTAAMDTAESKRQNGMARVNVSVRRPPGSQRTLSAKVLMWREGETNKPIQSMPITAQFLGELTAEPSRLNWVIPDLGTNKGDYPAQALRKTIKLKSVLGHDVEIRSVSTSIPGVEASISSKGPATNFELTVRCKEVPEGLKNGNVSVETSLPSALRIDVPITIVSPMH